MTKSIRKIVKIDEDKCNGCGLCVPSCAEGAIQIIDGKAKLVSETYCDGLGACLGDCPMDAITIEDREADAFDEAAVTEHLARTQAEPKAPAPTGGCPGAALRVLQPVAPASGGCPGSAMRNLTPPAAADASAAPDAAGDPPPSMLGQWPVQIHLVPPHAPFLAASDLVICADCVPFAVPDFHSRYLAGRSVVVGCPKLDDLAAYRVKLEQMFAVAKPKRITVLRMEVPCCGGLAQAAIEARAETAGQTPLEVHTIGIQGNIVKEEVTMV